MTQYIERLSMLDREAHAALVSRIRKAYIEHDPSAIAITVHVLQGHDLTPLHPMYGTHIRAHHAAVGEGIPLEEVVGLRDWENG